MFPSASQLQNELNSFTDIFGEEFPEENVSQPISLPTTCDSLPESLTNGLPTNGTKTNRPLKHTGQHGEFRSVEEIDPKYRCLFTYPYFNLVQSRIIEDALYSDKSMVVCAPTGSGKTVVFELAILQLLMQMENAPCETDFKIIYMAPVKAVCNERLTEWYPKLTKLGLLCIEVTGDTEVDFAQLKPYRVIITTPEKWDMLTRRWRDHRGLVEMIKLFLIDEVHILNDETRGPVLETVVSRMKTVESAAQSAHRIEQLQKQYQGAEDSPHSAPPRIRFVAVSATVSNPEDVADWLGTSEKPAVFYKFGDECRPVKLQRIVEGYPCAESTSIFKFDLILNYKLWPIIQKYYNGKPTLIFCNTRKSVTLTAEALSREVTVTFSPEQKAKLTALASTTKNKKLQMLIMSGVGCHHAGMLYEERVNIEQAFRNRDLPILITTTTLAMGVNLPAHLVIVKNTQQYVNGAYQEYSISTVLQMVGRAGRPQFDTEATAVIMTRLNDKARYQALVGGCEPLQSYLHKRIAENLNSEAALGTVTDVAQCVEWLRSTFLYVRAAKDPRRYLGLPPAAPMQLILKKIEELCVKAMNSLASSGLITMDEASCIESTEAGRLMSLFYLDVITMKNIMKIEGSETLEQLLWLVCESHELSDMHLRVDERRCLNLLNRNNAAATIRFPMKGKISTRQMKLNCIIQATLGCLPIPDPSLNQEALKVMKTASRVGKCLVRYVSHPELVSRQPQCFSAVFNSIVLSKCIEAHLWENSPYVSKQLKGIGPTFSTLLAAAGVTSFMRLEESHPRDLERIMNKGPPAGNVIRKQSSLLPKYQLTVTPIDSRTISVQLILLNHAHLSENMNQLTAGDSHKSYLIVGDSENNLILLTHFTDNNLISVYDGTMKYEITRKLCSEHKILIHCVSSAMVGIDAHADYLFLDLEPQAPRESGYFLCSNSNLPRKNAVEKQTTITDIYKERKRKNNFDNDITQCKEKKKRENALTQKLIALKESFGRTSKALKRDIDKSAKISTNIIHDLLDGKNMHTSPGQSIKNLPAEIPTVDLAKNVLAGPLEEIIINDDDDYIDDSQIDSILNKIESEITGNSISNDMQSEPKLNIVAPTAPDVHGTVKPMQHTETAESIKTYGNMNKPNLGDESTSSRCIRNLRKRKNTNIKSNFSCIDFIEKKANNDDAQNIVEQSSDKGFSEAIKCQINKFLQRAQDKTKHAMPEMNELLHTSYEELPEVHVKSDPTPEKYTCFGGDELDTIATKCDNEPVQCKKIVSFEIPQENILSEQNHLGDENCDARVILNLPEVHVKATPIIESNTCVQNPVQSVHNKNFIEFDHEIINNKKTDMYGILDENRKLKEDNREDENYNIAAMFTTAQRNANKTCNAITNYNDSENLASSLIINNKIINNVLIPSKTLCMSNEKSPPKSFEDITTQDENCNNKTMMPYRYKVETDHNMISQDDTQWRKSLVPSQKENQTVRVDMSNTVQQNSSKTPNIITNYNPYKLISNSNMNNMIIPSNTFCKWDKNSPEKLTENVTTPNKIYTNKGMMSYLYKVETDYNKKNKHDTRCLKSLIPYQGENQTVDKSVILYQNDRQNISHNIEIYSTSNTTYDCTAPKQKEVTQTRFKDLKPLECNETATPNHYQPYKLNHNVTNVSDINDYAPNVNYFSKQERHSDYSNQKETNYKKYSYSATKVDVCTKKCAHNRELRITRKVKIDLDMEVIKQEKTKGVDTNDFDIQTNQNNETDKTLNINTRNVSSEDEKYNLKYITNSRDVISSSEENEHNFKNRVINVVNGLNHTENDDAKKMTLECIEEKPKCSLTSNSIGNILQRYRKILVKRETNTPIVNKSNKITSMNNSTVVDKTNEPKVTVRKSRKPFRISDINSMDVPFPNNLTNATVPAPNPVPGVTYIQNETVFQDREVYTTKQLNSTLKICDDSDRYSESPDSVHSLQLDPIGDIKDDDNMFNPKLLLQYISEGSKEDTDIIAPPAPFSDDVPIMPNIEMKTEFHNDFNGYLQNFSTDMGDATDNFNQNFGNTENTRNRYYNSNIASDNSISDLQLPPKEIETWCLSRSRDEDCDNYSSQPVQSSPWIVSQRVHSSQANTSLGSRRANLCQFKFVRKKPLKF